MYIRRSTWPLKRSTTPGCSKTWFLRSGTSWRICSACMASAGSNLNSSKRGTTRKHKHTLIRAAHFGQPGNFFYHYRSDMTNLLHHDTGIWQGGKPSDEKFIAKICEGLGKTPGEKSGCRRKLAGIRFSRAAALAETRMKAPVHSPTLSYLAPLSASSMCSGS